MAVSDGKTRRHSAGVAAARCRHDGDFSWGARGLSACTSRAAVLSRNKRKHAAACMSINTWWLEVDAEADSKDTYDAHVSLFRPAMFRCIAKVLCVFTGILLKMATIEDPKLYHCHEPVTTALGCMCDRLLLPRAGLAAHDARLRGCRRVPGAAAGFLPPLVAAADSSPGAHLCHEQVLTCVPA